MGFLYLWNLTFPKNPWWSGKERLNLVKWEGQNAIHEINFGYTVFKIEIKKFSTSKSETGILSVLGLSHKIMRKSL